MDRPPREYDISQLSQSSRGGRMDLVRNTNWNCPIPRTIRRVTRREYEPMELCAQHNTNQVEEEYSACRSVYSHQSYEDEHDDNVSEPLLKS